MVAEPTPLVAVDDGNFVTDATTTAVIGPCFCPGRPHDQDTAEVLDELTWQTMSDVFTADQIGAKTVLLLRGSVVSWNLVDVDGDPVPLSDIVRMKTSRMSAIATLAWEAYRRTDEPLPNASGARSRPSRRASASPNPTIRPRAKRTR